MDALIAHLADDDLIVVLIFAALFAGLAVAAVPLESLDQAGA